jgi:predicted AlkP superfamily pyrophosphatase or phosphodiesterase
MKRPRLLFRICFLLCILFAFTSCTINHGVNTLNSANSSRGISDPARHLVFIGLDGWGGAYVPRADMPAVKRMMAGGASSLDARCVRPSITRINWPALFFGTPPEYRTAEQFPSIFTVVKNSGQENTPVLFYDWDDLHKICSDETADKLKISSDIESVQKIAAYFLENKPVFTAIEFGEPDITGHRKHWGSRAYYAKLAELDSYIALIEEAVKDAGVYDNTVFVFSADHGGFGLSHKANFRRNRKIPLIVFGNGIKEAYTIPSPVSICDIAPTMAAILGLEAAPEWTGNTLTNIFK